MNHWKNLAPNHHATPCRLNLSIFKGLPVAGRAALSLALAPALSVAPALGLLPATALAQSGAQTGAPASQPASATIGQAAQALRAITSLRAHFIQRSPATGQQVSGTFSLKQGGKLRFAYQAGYPLQISSDGKALTIIDTEVKQTQRWPVGNSPLGALLDPAKDVTRYGTQIPAYEPNTLAIRVVDRSHPEYGSMVLVFARKAAAPGGLELLGWETTDAQNRRTSVSLSGHQYGVALGDELFRTIDPRARTHK